MLQGKRSASKKDELASVSLFSNVIATRTSAILKSNKDLTFHIWTKPSSAYHTHENYVEIFVITEGKIIHHFGNKTMTMKKGDAFIMFPGQYHNHSPYKNYESQHVNLSFSLTSAKPLFAYCTGSEELHAENQFVHLSDAEFKVLLELQDLILKAPNDSASNTLTRSLIAFLLGAFTKSVNSNADSKGMPRWLEKFINGLQNINFEDPLDLSKLYITSGYSQTVVSKKFKEYTGQTLISYITDLRLNYAKNQLINTAFSVTEIARLSGFESYPHFSRVFKKKFNASPLQFRNSHAKNIL